jgi:hypothetical protein
MEHCRIQILLCGGLVYHSSNVLDTHLAESAYVWYFYDKANAQFETASHPNYNRYVSRLSQGWVDNRPVVSFSFRLQPFA